MAFWLVKIVRLSGSRQHEGSRSFCVSDFSSFSSFELIVEQFQHVIVVSIAISESLLGFFDSLLSLIQALAFISANVDSDVKEEKTSSSESDSHTNVGSAAHILRVFSVISIHGCEMLRCDT